jgi:hypothetical protein
MPKYEVTIREIETYVLSVEAGSEQEAKDLAWEMLAESGKDKERYHYDSDGDAEAVEID